MSVVNVTKMWSRDGGSVTGKEDDAQYRGYTRTTAYQVLTDDPETDLNDVENAAGIPEIGDPYPGSNLVFALRKIPKKIGPVFWTVDVEYVGDNELELNRPIIKKGSVTSSEPIDVDWNGRAIVNVNGEPVEGISRDVSDTVITITRNFLEVNDDLVLSYLESTNSDTWYGYAPGRARLTSYQAEEVYRSTSTVRDYWRVTATIQCRYGYLTTPDKAWYKRVRNEGLYEKIGSFLWRAVDDLREPVTKPVLLKSDGTRETDPNNAHFIYHQVYGSLPYNALGLL